MVFYNPYNRNKDKRPWHQTIAWQSLGFAILLVLFCLLMLWIAAQYKLSIRVAGYAWMIGGGMAIELWGYALVAQFLRQLPQQGVYSLCQMPYG